MTFARDIGNFREEVAVTEEEGFDLIKAFLDAFGTATVPTEDQAGEIEIFVQHACA